MEKVKETIKEIKNREHLFYCDECDKYLGASEEYDDGYYRNIGEFGLNFYIDGWYKLTKCLCDDCKKACIENIKVSLINIGFEKDKLFL